MPVTLAMEKAIGRIEIQVSQGENCKTLPEK
jgi:hypothetical protein